MEMPAQSAPANRNWQDIWAKEARTLAVDALKCAYQDRISRFTAPRTTFAGGVKWFEVTRRKLPTGSSSATPSL